ncbi:MAG: CTP synthase (glutamine hydrolyzing) [Candidatus Latescibacteria bacterium]|nr:CTP synthase (glutamine hydrolyzing) [Candidatus Latescibacterota bacterium]
MSGVGKGMATAATAKILTEYGFSVTAVKIDPYISFDAGLFRPTEHGEVWVTDDGGEIDQDLGNYERFLNKNISRTHNITTGQIYKTVIDRERRGEYLGATVELIPHITDEIKNRVTTAAENYDICMVEIGGTMGEYQNIPFLFAMKSLQIDIGMDSMMYVLITYLPVPSHIEEMKTKPTQQAIKLLSENAIFPDLILCRAGKPLDIIRKKKIQTYANISSDYVISAPDTNNLYSIPLNFEKEYIGRKIVDKLNLKPRKKPDWTQWKTYVKRIDKPKQHVDIAIVNKYVVTGSFKLADCFISVSQSLVHAGAELDVGVNIHWVDAKSIELTDDPGEILSKYDGILIPGGFGEQGFEGMIKAVRYARENNIPYLGLCFGMHLAICEFARNVCGLEKASSSEINPNTPHPVITIIESQKNRLATEGYGGTMRLGAYAAVLKKDTQIYNMYDVTGRIESDSRIIETLRSDPAQKFRLGKLKKNDVAVIERHRHRYEVNPDYIEILSNNGIVFGGHHIKNDGTKLMEFIEMPDKKCFIATQGHPEFTSRLGNPNPMFLTFVKASADGENIA